MFEAYIRKQYADDWGTISKKETLQIFKSELNLQNGDIFPDYWTLSKGLKIFTDFPEKLQQLQHVELVHLCRKWESFRNSNP